MKSSLWKIFFGITLLVIIFCYLIYDYPKLERNLVASLLFEKTKWSAFDNEWTFRAEIARTLVSENLLIGKSSAEIIDMLGQAEESHDTSPNKLRYGLKAIYGINIDPIAIEYLKITLNAENKVEKAEIEFHKTRDWRW